MAVDFESSGVPLIRLAGLKPGVPLLTGCNYLSPEKVALKWSHFRVRAGDVLLSTSASLGEVAVVDEDSAGAVPYTGIIGFRSKSPHLSQSFVRYLLQSPAFATQIEAMGVGSVMKHFGPMHLRQMVVSFPSVRQQHAIADMLGALDAKVAINTAIARTSDALLRARFVSATTLSSSTRRLGSLVTNVRDVAIPSPELSSTYVGLEHIPRRSMWLASCGHSSEVTSAKSSFVEGDILFGKLRPYFHKVVIAPTAGICSTDILVCRAKSPDLAGFALAALTSDDVVAQCSAAVEGTRMPRTSWRDLADCTIGWPGDGAARALSSDIDSIRASVEACLRENITLQGLRDTLLPALMSGRLRVKDAERQVEDAV